MTETWVTMDTQTILITNLFEISKFAFREFEKGTLGG